MNFHGHHHVHVTGLSTPIATLDPSKIIECKIDSQRKSKEFHAKKRSRPREWGIWAALLLLAWSPFADAQTPEQVNQAIDNGVSYLLSHQRPNGSWEEIPTYPGGVTALSTLALLSCDVKKDHDQIVRALDHLRKLDGAGQPKDTYVVALMTMVFAEASPKEDFIRIKRYAQWLMESQLPNGRWTYGRTPDRQLGTGDNSNTQFALLGLHAASQAGVDIPDHFWEKCRRYWVQDQARTGSWGYTPGSSSGSMTAAGIASLVISNQEAFSVEKGNVQGKPVKCKGAKTDENLQRGVDWFGRNFSVRVNPGGNNTWYYYYLYGMERAGRLSGRRFFGEHDWYRAGARALTSPQFFAQRPNGGWSATDDANGVCNTAFSLLFLSKGRIPIVINKLAHGPDDDWNNAPNDVHHLTQFLAKQWSVRLNWQIVDARVATTADLLQSPVLQLSGHEAPVFSAREKRLLREYVAEGGLILADANCSVEGFDEGFRALCKELFPEKGQELRRLEPEHGVWSSLFQIPPDWPLFGIDVGCRTAVFYSPDDLSCQWEYAHEESSIVALRLGANVVAYATGPEGLRDKLDERKTYDDVPEDQIRRGFLQIAKIRHNGDWNPAPVALRNLALALRSTAKVDTIAQERVIEILDPNLPNYPLAYMHGRTRFEFDRKELEVLAEYFKEGGVLFADACCGNERFDESFRAMVKQIFPDHPLEAIPETHELMTTKVGHDLAKVQFSPGLGNKTGYPILEGVNVDGRYAIVYSKYDLGCALQKQQSRDCKGYTHESAVQIAVNIALYALKQ